MDEKLALKHQKNFRDLLTDLGEDPERDGLQKTPERRLKAMSYLTSGYKEDVGQILSQALFEVDHQDLVIVRDIEVYSLCEHHILPFYGRCHVGYIPSKKIVGLSKIPRVVDVFARRLQVQERLTNEIADAITDHIDPIGVGVVIEAYHLCMMMRGVNKQNSYTMTSTMRGAFSDIATRSEFLSLIHARK